jgi:alpha-beta hydrolase superfamily lysophospholipase
MEAFNVPGHDQTVLKAYRMPPVTQAQPSAHTPHLLWLHGAFEHSLRYEPALRYFADRGWGSIIYDQRGHGYSGGRAMYLREEAEYVKDALAVYRHFEQCQQGALVLVGHSMGGLVAIRLRQLYPDGMPNLKSTILLSPFLAPGSPIANWKKAMARLMARTMPTFSAPTGIDPGLLSHDQAVVEAYNRDPLVHKNTTVGWFREIQHAQQRAFNEVGQLKGPLHIIYGNADQIVSTLAIRQFYKRLPVSIESSLKSYPGYYHELHNETGHEEPLQYIAGILNDYRR